MPKPYFYNKDEFIESLLRVDHSGEYGAVRIYEGQIKAAKSEDVDLLQTMLDQEKKHLEYFNSKIQNHESKPSLFIPIWHIGGFMMGKISSFFGNKTAMLCTEAVEEVINEHYAKQVEILESMDEKILANQIEKFRLEELEHKEIAINSGSQNIFLYNFIKKPIQIICKIAIFMSKNA